MGRPAFYTTPEEFKEAIEKYFEKNGSACTITGLAYELGFESRQSFYDYCEKGEYSYIGKRAKLFIESCYESKLSGNNPTGPIFFLKNMGWSDKTQQEISGPDGGPLAPPVINIQVVPPVENEE